MNKIYGQRNAGFTMLELALAITLIATLALVSYGFYRQEIARANIAELVTDIDAMRTAFTVEDRSGDSIPDFGNGKPGMIPAALSHVAVNEEMLSYPNLTLLFAYSYIASADDHVFLMVTSQNERGVESLRALSQTLPADHFIWVMEPVAAMVPMIGGVHATHALTPPKQVTAPKQPVQVTQAPAQQTQQVPVPQQPAVPQQQPTPVPNQQKVQAPPQLPQSVPQVASSSSSGGGSSNSGGGSSNSGGGSSSSGGGSQGSGGGSVSQPSYSWVPPGNQDDCHGHPNNNGHGHGHAYGHCNH